MRRSADAKPACHVDCATANLNTMQDTITQRPFIHYNHYIDIIGSHCNVHVSFSMSVMFVSLASSCHIVSSYNRHFFCFHIAGSLFSHIGSDPTTNRRQASLTLPRATSQTVLHSRYRSIFATYRLQSGIVAHHSLLCICCSCWHAHASHSLDRIIYARIPAKSSNSSGFAGQRRALHHA